MQEQGDWQAEVELALGKLKESLGENLHCVVLYGSAARGDFVEQVSDLNLLIILRDSTPQAHQALRTALAAQPRIDPFVLGLPGLFRSARAFPSKFRAIRRNHRVLFGPDLLSDLGEYPEFERYAAEQSLRNLRLRLVYSYLRLASDNKAYARFVLHFLPALHAAFNTALELEGISIPSGRPAQVQLYSEHFGADSTALTELAALKRSPRALSTAEVESFHARLFALVMAALAWAEERWPL